MILCICLLGFNAKSDININFMDVVETIKSVLYVKAINYSFFFKDKKYADEQESRILFLIEDKYNNKIVRYRKMNGEKIPYIKVYMKEDEIKIIEKFSNISE